MLLSFTDLIAAFFEYSFCTDPSRVQLRTRSRFPTPNGHSMCKCSIPFRFISQSLYLKLSIALSDDCDFFLPFDFDFFFPFFFVFMGLNF
ncbi:hypothetical protein JHK82_044614 [Glycine max]|uniref:Uncharacterized protein n=2 Tax=Glycine subgen. Soja TaxID=1462606 RepID=A0A0R0FNW5_SOYBN|nr:hypothetical protein JHK86_045016 [Glycine max]KAG4940935.1 hypothetical protein JHK87_044806 [Glycine soja]KAG4951717.1 hypothetical protein JHK85_045584 [Glycine max]KAG5099562.1 hypothetical protein JHK82_044614 [Glycine max]KAG5108164.1 hypothetical protein JHK84_045071 [Glycine max]